MVTLELTRDEFTTIHDLFLREFHQKNPALPECTWGEHTDCTTCNLDQKFYEKYMEL